MTDTVPAAAPRVPVHAPPATRRLAVLATLGAVAAWGIGPNLAKLMHTNGLTVAFHRMWIAAAVLGTILVARRRRPSASDMRPSLLAGFVFGLNACFFFSAVKHTSVADATLIASLSPVMILVVAGRWFGERVTAKGVVWTLVAIAGVAVVVLGSSKTAAWSLYGDGLATLALVTWTAYFLLSKSARRSVGTLEFQFGVTAGATAVVGAVALATGGVSFDLDGRDVALLVGLVAGPGLGGHTLMAWAHRYVDVSASSVIVVAQPLLAAAVAAAVVDEPVTAIQVAGAIVVVVAIAAVVRSNRRLGEDVTAEPVESV